MNYELFSYRFSFQYSHLLVIVQPSLLFCSSVYRFSLALWQITSTEKLNASANAMESQKSALANEMISITRQNTLVITVNAFFSEKYLRRKLRSKVNNFLSMPQR